MDNIKPSGGGGALMENLHRGESTEREGISSDWTHLVTP